MTNFKEYTLFVLLLKYCNEFTEVLLWFKPLTSDTVEIKFLWSYTQPSIQDSVSGSVILKKVSLKCRRCHCGWTKRWHFSGLRLESRGMEILNRSSWLMFLLLFLESVSLSRMWTQQRWPRLAAVKFSNIKWGATMTLQISRKAIWRIWNLPWLPTRFRSSWKAMRLNEYLQWEVKMVIHR